MKTVSIIVPAYNAERWIEDCCRSVFRQTYENWELIVIDDGSGDETWNCLMRLSGEEPRLRPVRRENGGVSRARNCGLSLARGEYLAFLDTLDFTHCISGHSDIKTKEAQYRSLLEG